MSKLDYHCADTGSGRITSVLTKLASSKIKLEKVRNL